MGCPGGELIDQDKGIQKMDDLINIYSEQIEYLDHRLELDQLTFFFGFNINIGLVITIYSYIGAACYTIFEKVMEEQEGKSD